MEAKHSEKKAVHHKPVKKVREPEEGELLEDAHDVRTLLAWYAPGRPFRQRSKEFYLNSLLIVLALEVILFLFAQYLLMLVILSIAFLSYALSITPPAPLYYRISSEGVLLEDHFYLWQELYDFYFTEQHGDTLVHIRTKTYLPGELIILCGDVPRDTIRQTLLPYLPYREVVRKTFTEKAGTWLAQSFPLERPVVHKEPVASKPHGE
jgi:hypothetical protein